MVKSFCVKMGLDAFISFEEFMSAKPPCGNCLVKTMCIGEGMIINYFGPDLKRDGKKVPTIIFRDICDDTEKFLNNLSIEVREWPS